MGRGCKILSILVATVMVCLGRTVAPQGASAPLASAGEAALGLRAGDVELVGQIGGATYAAAVEGDYAFCGVGPRLVVLDVSNPSHPQELGQTDVLPGIVRDVAIAGEYAFVTLGPAGMQVVGLSDYSHPPAVSLFDPIGEVNAVALRDGCAYLAEGPEDMGNQGLVGGGLRILDCSSPWTPRELSFHSIPSYSGAQDLAIIGNVAYAVGSDAGLWLFDVSDPENVRNIGSFETEGSANGVAVQGSLAYVAEGREYKSNQWVGGALRVLDVTDLAAPQSLTLYDALEDPQDVVVDGNRAYVADGSNGLYVLDVSQRASVTLLGSFDTPGSARRIAVSGLRTYVADDTAGLRIVDMSAAGSPTELGSYYAPGWGFDTAISGSRVYLAGATQGLNVIDVHEPSQPLGVGAYDTPGAANGIALSGRWAFLTDGWYGLRIIDVLNPSQPVETGFHDTPGFACDVDLSGAYAYVADEDGGLRVLDVSDKTTPAEAGAFDVPRWARDVTVLGNCAYLAEGSDGVRIIDISDPASPREISRLAQNHYASAVQVREPYAYSSLAGEGLLVVDVSDPSRPAIVGVLSIPGGANHLALASTYVFIAAGDQGLSIVDVSNPRAPRHVASYDTPGYAGSVRLSQDHIFLTDGDGGLLILRWAQSLPTPQPSATPTGIPLFCPEPANGHREGACGPLASGADYQGCISSQDDALDWFYFDMATEHAIEAWLGSIPSGCDYDLYLVGEHETVPITTSAREGTRDEYIHFGPLPAGRYYVVVVQIQGWDAVSPYRLRVEYGQAAPTAMPTSVGHPHPVYLPAILKRRF